MGLVSGVEILFLSHVYLLQKERQVEIQKVLVQELTKIHVKLLLKVIEYTYHQRILAWKNFGVIAPSLYSSLHKVN